MTAGESQPRRSLSVFKKISADAFSQYFFRAYPCGRLDLHMTYHPVVSQIKNLLVQQDVWFETFEHEPVLTSEQAAGLRDGYTLHQGAKALIVRVKAKDKTKFFSMLVLPGDLKFSTEKVKQLFNAKDIRFATVEEIDQITQGVLPGGVPPFGHLFNLQVYVDPSLLANEKIIFNAGDRAYSIAMQATDYQKIVQPILAELI